MLPSMLSIAQTRGSLILTANVVSPFPGVVLHSLMDQLSIPAVATSVFIGLGILVCGAVMLHSVLLWRKVCLPRPVNLHVALHFSRTANV